MAIVEVIDFFHGWFGRSAPKHVAIPINCVDVDRETFVGIVSAEHTASRVTCQRNGFAYLWRGGKMGFYLRSPDKSYLIHPDYVPHIKLKV